MLTEPWWYYLMLAAALLFWVGALISYWLEGRDLKRDRKLWDDYQRGIR